MEDQGLLLNRIALGDRAAFSALYAATSAKLFAICLRILNNGSEAEDAVQEVYIKVWRRAGHFSAEQGHAMTWLAALARNHAIDIIRARKPQADSIDETFDLASSEPDPEAAAINTSEGGRIDTCMQTLEADRAEAVRRAYVEGLSYQELAELYRVPLNTMRTWLRRSLLKLRECLGS
jgi:RNA polymerase sigma-70 factor, ECF subfamily